jgi:uncharacterized protein (DUF433 family)
VTRHGWFVVPGARVSLDVLLADFERGKTPEWIHEANGTVSLADVHAVFAYYFRHRTGMEAYLAERERALGSRPGSRRTIPPRASGPRCWPALIRGPTVPR